MFIVNIAKDLATYNPIVGKYRNIGEGSSSNIDKNASEEFRRLFIVHTETGSPEPSFWLLDSGCSSHMTERKDLFYHLDETQKHFVKLGDNKEL